MYSDVKALLTSREIQCRLLDASEAEAVRTRWLSTFAAKNQGVGLVDRQKSTTLTPWFFPWFFT